MGSLAKNIISTLVYYDVLGYPMTSFEIWKYLLKITNYQLSITNENAEEVSLLDVINELESDNLKKFVEEYRGFFFLKGQKRLVEQRIRRSKISDRKIKKIRKIVFWIRFIPFIKMIAVAGRVGAKNAQDGSDIDMLVVFKRGKIFTGRFLTTAWVHFFGQRRHKNKIANRICLNHFLTNDFNISIQDLYSAHSYVFAVPLYNGKIFQEFLQKNQWIKEYRPNFFFLENNSKEVEDGKISFWMRWFLEIIFKPSWIENLLKNWQIEKIKNNPLTQKVGGVIIYNDSELAFWPDFENQGPKIFEKFKKKLSEIEVQ